MSNIKQIKIGNTPYDLKDETARLGKLDNSNVSTVQTTLTASKNYAINDPFIYEGQLYKADSAISSGGTITIGTNASTTTIEELLALKITANGGESGNTVVTFTDASADGTITSGSALKTIIGLIKYKFAHLINGHTIVNSSGLSQTARSKLKFTGSATVTDDSTNDQTIVNITGGGSGGHTILNSSGSAMNQRGKLQFDGLNVSDDSTNDKTVVTAPTPDYVDEQYSSSKTYSKGMTCISGNVRYRYINSTASSGHTPPNSTYWEECSIASQLNDEVTLIASGNITSWTDESAYNRCYARININPASVMVGYEGVGKLFLRATYTRSDNYKWSYITPVYYDNSINGICVADIDLAFNGVQLEVQYNVINAAVLAYLIGANRNSLTSHTWNIDLIGKK